MSGSTRADICFVGGTFWRFLVVVGVVDLLIGIRGEGDTGG
jgi:hypothetical protein